ncbi:MAG TPA: hypothetical protein VG722_09470, partial [Tepidisphaeraceae bacterium]|nr:hypothetical protein [Tepidisphaeraceae bacterium]
MSESRAMREPGHTGDQNCAARSLTVIRPTANPAGIEAFECWREIARPLFDVLPRTALPEFTSTSAFVQINDVILAHNVFSACRFTRD